MVSKAELLREEEDSPEMIISPKVLAARMSDRSASPPCTPQEVAQNEYESRKKFNSEGREAPP